MSRFLRALLPFVLAACSGTVAPTGSPQTPGAGSSAPTAAPSIAATASAPSSPAATPSVVVRPGEAWIVYQYWNGRADIRLVRPDGTGMHALLPGAGSGPETTHPDWAPDGTRIAYVSENAIWVANVDGTAASQVSTACSEPCSEDYPAWSPDGTSIAYARWQAEGTVVPHGGVVVVGVAAGREATVLTTDGPEYPAYPRWSPDGRSMVIELDRFADTGVETSRVVGSEIATFTVAKGASSLVRLTKPGMFGAYPDWSREGSRIVFSTYDLGYRDGGSFVDTTPPSNLYTIAPDGSSLTQLTQNAAGPTLVRNGTASGPLSTQPTWTPDGRSIIFVQVDGATWPGWQLASLRPDITGLPPTTVPANFLGTHPRLRPVR